MAHKSSSFSLYHQLFFRRFFLKKNAFVFPSFFLIFGIFGLLFSDTISTQQKISLFLSPKISVDEEKKIIDYLSNSTEIVSFQKLSKDETNTMFISQLKNIEKEDIPELPVSLQLILSPLLPEQKRKEFLFSLQSFREVLHVDGLSEQSISLIPSWSQSLILWIIILFFSFFFMEKANISQFYFFSNEWKTLWRFGVEPFTMYQMIFWDGFFLTLLLLLFESILFTVFFLVLLMIDNSFLFKDVFFDGFGLFFSSFVLIFFIVFSSAILAFKRFCEKEVY